MDASQSPTLSARSLARRIFAFPATRLVIGIVLMILAGIVANYLSRAIVPSREGLSAIPAATIIAVVLVAAYLGFTLFIERRGTAEFA